MPATAEAPSCGYLTSGPGPTYGIGITIINLQCKSELPEWTAVEVHSKGKETSGGNGKELAL
jgi:hypothetical protein